MARLGRDQSLTGTIEVFPLVICSQFLCIAYRSGLHSREARNKSQMATKDEVGPNTGKYNALCEFHQERGHKIEDCIALILEVANLLQQGHLKELLSDKDRNTLARCREHPGPPKPSSLTCTINMIISGSDDASINGIKFTATHKLKRSITHERYDGLEESIILDESDAESLNFPYNDPLVIPLRVLDTVAKRFMVDEGSGDGTIHL
ncbi:PREDICTED: uncharacterized protein LOC109214372 [Nicotiana attenuata]|uniref:uncharacterized protein LOC109214372 n=1 Tax=Nicotiana attenuata TaxID=49451 RepID=UPI00090513A2|nr:PREDICTED: uncharacterized protein LOC109214372 [Nicotiana attenuata]